MKFTGFTQSMKKYLVIGLAVIGLLAGWLIWRSIQQAQTTYLEALETDTVRQGSLITTFSTNGMVRANQSARLVWKTSGEIESMLVSPGDTVEAGDKLAILKTTSLSKAVILARADLVTAQRALEDLHVSNRQKAAAWQALELAKQALETAQQPELRQAQALAAVAQAEAAVEEAQQSYDILVNPPSQAGIDQAYANLLLAENALEKSRTSYERIQRRAEKDPDTYYFFESRSLYQKILESLEIKLSRDQRSYEDALSKFNQLLQPADPTDLAVAETKLAKAKAQLQQAQRDWERVRDGPDPVEIALRTAQLADAQRVYEQVKDGPQAADITAAEARIAAAQAVLNQEYLAAPFAGTVTSTSGYAGSPVESGTAAIQLDDLSHLLVDAQVTEIDVNRIEIGQPVIVTLEAAHAKEYQAAVIEIPMIGDLVGGTTRFNVVVEIANPDEQVRPGMTATLKFVTADLPNVLQVPNQALRLRDGERVVYVLREGQIVPVPITLGIASENYTQVLSGELKVGEVIVLNPPTSATEGSG